MDDLVVTAKKLRAVRKACRHFLTLWALEQMASDARKECSTEASDFESNPFDRNWKAMYQGDVLDD